MGAGIKKWVLQLAQPLTICGLCSRVAQSVEQVAVNHRVGGSIPSPGAIFTCPVLKSRK